MNNCVKIIDINKPENPIRSIDNIFKGNVTAIGCFAKEKQVIYTACEDGGLRIFDQRNKNLIE
jgi:WD40 repeat protein